MIRKTDRLTTACLLCALASAVGIAGHAYAGASDVRAAEELVFAVYYEGLPHERARRLTPSGAEHLAEILRAGDHPAFHSNIVLALGISGHARTFETLEWYGRDEPGEVASGVYRARIAVPIAMGHLAVGDDRALAWLTGRARAGAKPPSWKKFGASSEHLVSTMRAQILNGLAVSGRSAAADILNEIAQDDGDSAAVSALQLFHRLRAAADSRPGESR